MNTPLKSRKTHHWGVNWKIREIFSESAFASFRNEIDNRENHVKEREFS
tara:strand:- start:3402 stop:3548 length:147 start_codon:yes stop_codon:yes gene_type:complete